MYLWRTVLAVVAAGAVLTGAPVRAAKGADDPYSWLEHVTSSKALAWVKQQNQRSLAELEADPRFQPMYREALSILTSDTRIPYGTVHAGAVYNFWQDDLHVRGLWRRASLESYESGRPKWQTLIDYDELAHREHENWVAGSVVCLEPRYRHCMVGLSRGGKDAAVWREFDTASRTFVANGFFVPEAKSDVAWVDADTLLVGTDLGPGSLTGSGYPRTVVRVHRGQALQAAPLVLEGERTDVSVSPRVEQDDGKAHVCVARRLSFFETRYFCIPDGGGQPVRLPLPQNVRLEGMLDGRALFYLREPWRYRGADYAEGDVIAYDLASGAAETVFPGAGNRAVQDVQIGRSDVLIQYLEDVVGKAVRVARDEHGRWRSADIPLPRNGVVSIVSAGGGTDDALLSFESLTTPDTLYVARPRGRVKKVAQAPAYYDATDVTVLQRFATSKDGTRIPYFIAARRKVLAKGDAPTVQYGYGGFLIPTLPVYYEDPGRPQHGALAGRMWLSRGGVLVLANIRGGGEYGPAWHKAAMKEKHQNAIDDFVAVSEDLIRSGVTTPEKLGAIGRSNGGLLMGAILTQRPDLYAAIDCGVPLFDMKRYTKLGAGASWIAEYGDPANPADWAYLSKYSPYQHLKANQPYPKVFIYTSTKDDRVHPGHARKAAARLGQLGYDYFYYENTEGGHGGTANQKQLALRTALEYAYFARELMPAGPN